MKRIVICLLCCYAFSASAKSIRDTLPFALPARFVDDYGVKYTISDTLWFQHPSAKYHIIRWNKQEHYLIARNDENNPSEKGLYSRIDYMKFTGMEPFLWGFCLTTYDAATVELAEKSEKKADRQNPRKGCNGFPFSRMKKVE